MLIDEDVLIFDLDGTLFDSAPQIIDCFNKALKKNNIKVADEINESLIGPTINETLKILLQKKDHNKIDLIIKDFKELYDLKYCFETKLYDGVRETLRKLSRTKRLILITNKRLTPTVNMLKNTNIMKYFDEYFSVDQNIKSIKNKTLLIAKTIRLLKIDPKNAVYIGDTNGDHIASKKNNIKFAFACWGYGKCKDQAEFYLEDIRELT